MIGAQNRKTRPGNQSLAVLERDAALVRVGRTRRFVIVATAALTAAVAALVSAVAPGRSLGAKAQTTPATAARVAAPSSGSATAPGLPPLASPGSLGLQGPSEAPQPVPDQSQAPSDPSQGQAQPAPAASPQSSGGGAVVSGGS
jgi:hypothetical protein